MKSRKISLIMTPLFAGLLLLLNSVGLLPVASQVYAAPHCFWYNDAQTAYEPATVDCSGGIINPNSDFCYFVGDDTSTYSVGRIDCADIFRNKLDATPIWPHCYSYGQVIHPDGELATDANGTLTMTLTDPEDQSTVSLFTAQSCNDLVFKGVTGLQANANKCYVVDTDKPNGFGEGSLSGRKAVDTNCTAIYLQAMKALSIQAKLNALKVTPTPTIQGHQATKCSVTGNNCGIIKDYVVPGINFLSAGVVLIVIAMIVLGGIQYSAAQDNAQAASAAKTRIYNAVLALLLYFFMFGILEWLIPGGVFNK